MNDLHKLIEQKLSSKEVFRGGLLHVFSDEVRLPDKTTSTREWIRHPGASAVLPVFEDGDVMLIRQFRYPMDQVFYEVPAGKLDPGEKPGRTAVRELKEETGLVCRQYRDIGHFCPSIGYTDEIIYLYVAWDVEIAEHHADDDEFIIKEKLPFKKTVEMVYSGEITDGKTMVTVLKAWCWWQQHGPFEV